MTKYLFVGGSADGQRIDVPNGTPKFIVPVLNNRKPLPVKADDAMPEFDQQTEEDETYVRGTLRIYDFDLHYYHTVWLSEKEAVLRVFGSYPYPKCRCQCHR